MLTNLKLRPPPPSILVIRLHDKTDFSNRALFVGITSNPLNEFLHTPSLSRFRATRAGLLALFCAGVLLQSASAVTYYWDTNNSTAGFGTAGGTWAAPTTNNSTQGWSTSSVGNISISGSNTTTTSDDLNFGTATDGLATGTITVSGNVSAKTMTFGTASGNITLSGGNISLAGNIVSGNSTRWQTITSNITLAAAGISFSGASNMTFNGVISGANDLATDPTYTMGPLTFNGNNTYTGNFSLWRGSVNFNSIANAGQSSALGAGSTITLALGGGQNNSLNYTGATAASTNRTFILNGGGETLFAQSGALVITGNVTGISATASTLQLSGIADTGINEISGVISGNFSSLQVNNLTPTGGASEAGYWILSGNNTFTGTLQASAGSTLVIGATGRLGAGNYSSNITLGGTFIYNGTTNQILGGVISGGGALTKNNTSTLTLTGNNTYSGATTINAGTLQISSTGLLGGGAYSGNIANNATLIYSGTNNQTLSGVISGSGALTHNASSTLTLTGVNTYTGVTTISAGTLQIGTGTTGSIDNTSSIVNNRAVIFNKNSDFTIKGMTGTGNLTVNATTGGFQRLGGNITLNGSVVINSRAGGSTGTAGIRQSAATTITAASISMNGILGSGANDSNYALTLDTSAVNGAITLDLGNGQGGYVYNGASSLSANAGTGTLTWQGTNAQILTNASAQQSFSSVPITLTGGLNISTNLNLSAGSSVITLNAKNTSTVSGNLTLGNNSANTWTVDPSVTMTVSGILAGNNGSITKNGTGTLTLSNAANTYNGTTTINAGTLTISGSSTSSAITIASGGTLNATGTAGATTVNSGGTLIGTGTVGAITLNTGGLIGPGTGTATVGKLTGSSLSIGSSSGYAFTIGNVNASVAGTDFDQISLSGALTFNNTAANPFTVYLYGTPTGWSNTGIYSWDLITGATSMDDFVAASFATDFTNFGITAGSRNGTWSFSSPTDGTIRLTYAGSAGTSTWNTTTGSWNTAAQWSETAIPVNNNSLLFTGSGGTATNNISNSTLTSVNNITFESGAGAYTLAANVGSAGASGGTALAVAGAITNNSTNLQTINTAISLASSIIVNAASGNITIGGVISGNAAITKSGANSLTLSTANTYSGGTALNAGTLNIGNATAIGTGTLTITSGTIDNTSGGALTLSNNNAQNWNGNFTFVGTNNLNMGTGNVTLGATPTVTVSAGNLTVGGVISGSGRGLTKAGSGTMILTGANTYNGVTTISAGTLQVGTGTTGSIDNTSSIVNNGTVIFNKNSDFTIKGMTGTGNLTANATSNAYMRLGGNITVSGPVSLTGRIRQSAATTITAASISMNGILGSGGNDSNFALTLDTSAVNGAITLDLGNGLSGSLWNGASSMVANAGTGTLTFQGTNGAQVGNGAVPTWSGTSISLAGGLNISTNLNMGTVGTLTLNATGASSVTGNLGLASSSTNTWTVNPGLTMTASGNISGTSAAITKNGTGTLILSAANNTYTGATTVNAGTLQLSGNISSSALTLNSGGIISVGTNTTIAKYNASTITIGAGSGYIFTIGSNASGTTAGTDFDQLTATGALTFNNTAASPFTVYVNGTPTNWSNTGNYTWNIMSGASISGFNSGNFAVNTNSFGIASGNRTGTWSVGTAGSNLTLSYTLATPDYFWSGGSGNWTDGFTPSAPTVDDNLYFTGAGGTVTNNMTSGTISSVNFITFNSTAGAYTLAAASGAAGAAGGTALTVKGDIVNYSNSTQTISMALNLGASSSGVINTAAGNITISGNITGSTGITKTGTGTLTLSGSGNTYNGTTTINGGKLTLGAAGRGNFTVNSGATLVGGPNYFNTVSSVTVNSGTLNPGSYQGGGLVTVNLNDATVTGGGSDYFGGGTTYNLTGNNSWTGSALDIRGGAVVLNSINGTTTIARLLTQTGGGSLTKNGSGSVILTGVGVMSSTNTVTVNNGTLSISGAQTYSGVTTLNGGTLAINSATAIGNGTLTIKGGTLDNTSGSAITLTNNNTQNWNGDFSFLGTNGSLNIGTGAVTMNASRTVTVSNSTFTVGGAIGGSTFGLTKNGSGTLVLSGANTYNGTTTVNNGTITLGAADRIANTSDLNVAGGTFNLAGFNETLGSITGSGNITLGAGTLTTNSTSNTTFSGIISGTGGLTKNGTSTLTLSGNNSYNGTTTINTGTLQISTTGQLGGGNYSGNIANTGTFRYNSTANQTLGGIISGNGALVKNAASTLTLSGNNTYTGTTTITAGTLQISSTGLLGGGNYSANISNTGTLLIASNSNQTLGGVISGSGALTKNGTGVLTLSGNNTYSGATTLTAGQININSATAIGTGTLTITGGTIDNTSGSAITLTNNNAQNWNGDFTFNGTKDLNLGTGAVAMNASRVVTVNAGNLTVGGAIAGSTFGLTKNGSGTMILTGANTYNGTTTINAGTLTISGGSAIADAATVTLANTAGVTFNINGNETIGSLQGGGVTGGSVALASGQTLTVAETGSNSFNGSITGAGNLIKSGAGNMTLAGTSTFNGTTTINAGKLVVNGSAANSAVTIATGATLGGTGTVGATTVSGTIAPGNSPGTLTVGSLTLNSGGVYTWEMADATGVAGTGWDRIASSGLLTVNSTSGSTFTIAITSSGAPSNWNYQTSNQSWDIITYGSVSGFDATKFSINATAFGGTLGAGNSSTWAITDTGSALRLTYSILSDPIWAGGTGNWTTGFSPAITNGANSTFTGAGGTATNTIASATLSSLGSITFNSTAGAYTLAADSGSSGYDAASAFTLNGNIVNNSTATQTINLALTSNATRVYDAAAGNITIGGAISGTGGLTKNGSNTLALSVVNTYTGATTINAGTLTISSEGQLGSGNYSGNIANAGTLNYASSANQTLSGIISGNGSLTKSGASTLTLTGVETYTGATTITAGTLTISGAGQLGSGNYSGNIANAGTLNYASSANQTLSGTISGTGGLTKNGTGTLTLSHANTYTGNTTIDSGTLRAEVANALGDTREVMVNEGGSLLIAASEAIYNSANVTLHGGTMKFEGNVNETLGFFTLSANSTIDMAAGNIWLQFSGLSAQMQYDLKIYNYTLYSDYLYFVNVPNVSESLSHIRFYSGTDESSFIGNSFIEGLSPYHVRPVPEPETYATAALLLLGLGIYAYRRRQVRTTA